MEAEITSVKKKPKLRRKVTGAHRCIRNTSTSFNFSLVGKAVYKKQIASLRHNNMLLAKTLETTRNNLRLAENERFDYHHVLNNQMILQGKVKKMSTTFCKLADELKDVANFLSSNLPFKQSDDVSTDSQKQSGSEKSAEVIELAVHLKQRNSILSRFSCEPKSVIANSPDLQVIQEVSQEDTVESAENPIETSDPVNDKSDSPSQVTSTEASSPNQVTSTEDPSPSQAMSTEASSPSEVTSTKAPSPSQVTSAEAPSAKTPELNLSEFRFASKESVVSDTVDQQNTVSKNSSGKSTFSRHSPMLPQGSKIPVKIPSAIKKSAIRKPRKSVAKKVTQDKKAALEKVIHADSDLTETEIIQRRVTFFIKPVEKETDESNCVEMNEEKHDSVVASDISEPIYNEAVSEDVEKDIIACSDSNSVDPSSDSVRKVELMTVIQQNPPRQTFVIPQKEKDLESELPTKNAKAQKKPRAKKSKKSCLPNQPVKVNEDQKTTSENPEKNTVTGLDTDLKNVESNSQDEKIVNRRKTHIFLFSEAEDNSNSMHETEKESCKMNSSKEEMENASPDVAKIDLVSDSEQQPLKSRKTIVISKANVALSTEDTRISNTATNSRVGCKEINDHDYAAKSSSPTLAVVENDGNVSESPSPAAEIFHKRPVPIDSDSDSDVILVLSDSPKSKSLDNLAIKKKVTVRGPRKVQSNIDKIISQPDILGSNSSKEHVKKQNSPTSVATSGHSLNARPKKQLSFPEIDSDAEFLSSIEIRKQKQQKVRKVKSKSKSSGRPCRNKSKAKKQEPKKENATTDEDEPCSRTVITVEAEINIQVDQEQMPDLTESFQHPRFQPVVVLKDTLTHRKNASVCYSEHKIVQDTNPVNNTENENNDLMDDRSSGSVEQERGSPHLISPSPPKPKGSIVATSSPPLKRMRRQSKAVSYKEPSLNKKMRRY